MHTRVYHRHALAVFCFAFLSLAGSLCGCLSHGAPVALPIVQRVFNAFIILIAFPLLFLAASLCWLCCSTFEWSKLALIFRSMKITNVDANLHLIFRCNHTQQRVKLRVETCAWRNEHCYEWARSLSCDFINNHAPKHTHIHIRKLPLSLLPLLCRWDCDGRRCQRK